jgi:hypothetical protein
MHGCAGAAQSRGRTKSLVRASFPRRIFTPRAAEYSAVVPSPTSEERVRERSTDLLCSTTLVGEACCARRRAPSSSTERLGEPPHEDPSLPGSPLNSSLSSFAWCTASLTQDTFALAEPGGGGNQISNGAPVSEGPEAVREPLYSEQLRKQPGLLSLAGSRQTLHDRAQM